MAHTARRAGRPRAPATHGAPHSPSRRPAPARRPPHAPPCAQHPIRLWRVPPRAYKREVDSSAGNSNKYPHVADAVALLGGRAAPRGRDYRTVTAKHTPRPEIALGPAYIRKIHLCFSTHRSLSARCDLSSARCIPPHACEATCIDRLRTLPGDRMYRSMTTYTCDRVCRRSTTNMPIFSEPLPHTTSIPPPRRHACTTLWPRVWLRDRVPQQNSPYLSNAHRDHR